MGLPSFARYAGSESLSPLTPGLRHGNTSSGPLRGLGIAFSADPRLAPWEYQLVAATRLGWVPPLNPGFRRGVTIFARYAGNRGCGVACDGGRTLQCGRRRLPVRTDRGVSHLRRDET